MWLAFALSAALLGALYELLARILSVRSDNPRAFSVWFGMLSAGFSLGLLVVEPLTWRPLTATTVALTLVVILCYALHDRTQFYAAKYIEASVLTLLWQLVPVIGSVTAVISLHETVTATKVLAVALIVGGNLLVAYRHPHLRANKGLLYALAAAFAIGIAEGVNKLVSASYALPVYTALSFMGPALINVSLPPLPPAVLGKELSLGRLKLIALAAVSLLNYYVVLKAYRYTDASRVIPVTAASTVVVVLVGIIFFHERSHIGRKLIAAILVFAGIVILGRG